MVRYCFHVLILAASISFAKPERIALLGDSMGAGTFAGAEPSMNYVNEHNGFVQWLVRSFLNQPRYSFFEGDRVNSIASRLRIETGGEVEADNYAVAGAVVLDALTKQLPKMVREVSYHGRYDKVFLFIGANDLCSQTKNYSDHQEWLLAALANLADEVYAVPLPPIHEVWTVSDRRNIIGLKATTVWKLIGICHRMTLDGEQYFAANSRWRNKWNQTLKLHAQTYGAVYAGSVERLKFHHSFVGRVDMFHPSRKAHEVYAEAIWGHVWTKE